MKACSYGFYILKFLCIFQMALTFIELVICLHLTDLLHVETFFDSVSSIRDILQSLCFARIFIKARFFYV